MLEFDNVHFSSFFSQYGFIVWNNFAKIPTKKKQTQKNIQKTWKLNSTFWEKDKKLTDLQEFNSNDFILLIGSQFLQTFNLSSSYISLS